MARRNGWTGAIAVLVGIGLLVLANTYLPELLDVVTDLTALQYSTIIMYVPGVAVVVAFLGAWTVWRQ